MLAVAVFEETEETVSCSGCGKSIPVDDDSFFSAREAGCIHEESGYYCDSCWPYCYSCEKE